jgi:hypothetical protein
MVQEGSGKGNRWAGIVNMDIKSKGHRAMTDRTGLSESQFLDRFVEPDQSAMRLHSMVGARIYRLLWAAGAALPEDCRQLRGLIGTVLAEVFRGSDTEMLRTIAVQLLELAYPAIDERRANLRDQIERLISDGGLPTHEDEIPY